MTKIAIILCYFGKLPENFSLFAESCRRNATIDFLLFTDDTPTHLPENMHLHPTTFAALQRRVAGCFDFAITLHTPYKLCDYKPARRRNFCAGAFRLTTFGATGIWIWYSAICARILQRINCESMTSSTPLATCPSTATRRRIMPFTANR